MGTLRGHGGTMSQLPDANFGGLEKKVVTGSVRYVKEGATVVQPKKNTGSLVLAPRSVAASHAFTLRLLTSLSGFVAFALDPVVPALHLDVTSGAAYYTGAFSTDR